MNPKNRPAESVTLAAGVAAVVAHFLGVSDPGTITALAGIIAALPALVTAIVSRLQARKVVSPQLVGVLEAVIRDAAPALAAQVEPIALQAIADSVAGASKPAVQTAPIVVPASAAHGASISS
jgi:hypothetical protein